MLSDAVASSAQFVAVPASVSRPAPAAYAPTPMSSSGPVARSSPPAAAGAAGAAGAASGATRSLSPNDVSVSTVGDVDADADAGARAGASSAPDAPAPVSPAMQVPLLTVVEASRKTVEDMLQREIVDGAPSQWQPLPEMPVGTELARASVARRAAVPATPAAPRAGDTPSRLSFSASAAAALRGAIDAVRMRSRDPSPARPAAVRSRACASVCGRALTVRSCAWWQPAQSLATAAAAASSSALPAARQPRLVETTSELTLSVSNASSVTSSTLADGSPGRVDDEQKALTAQLERIRRTLRGTLPTCAFERAS